MQSTAMVTNGLLAVIFMAAVVNAHSIPDGSEDFDMRQRTCSKDNPCPAPAVCCLTGYQGRCYYGSTYTSFGYVKTDPIESATCLLNTTLALGRGEGDPCAKDSDCDCSECVCTDMHSNSWGVCAVHPCFETQQPCDLNQCIKDASGPGFTCNCENNVNGTLLTDKTTWTIGELCDEPHPCAAGDVHNCGDFGTCLRNPDDPESEVCECDAEWFGEKCNWEGACQLEDNACAVSTHATNAHGATCTSASVTDYTCSCDDENFPNYSGKDCDEPNLCTTTSCGSASGWGECIVDDVTEDCMVANDLGCTYTVTSHCECEVNHYGAACGLGCGGSSLSSGATLTFRETDAVCVYEDLDLWNVTIFIQMDSPTVDDDNCLLYYVEAYLADDEVPTAADDESSTDLNRYCVAGSSSTLAYRWTTQPSRIVVAAEAGTKVIIAVAQRECEADWYYLASTDSCYKYTAEKKNYTDAIQNCTDEGALLSTAKTEEENTFIAAFKNTTIDPAQWLGASDATVEGTWEWSDAVELLTGDWVNWNWAAGEPSNSTSLEDCLVQDYDGSSMEDWTARACDLEFAFTCEKRHS